MDAIPHIDYIQQIKCPFEILTKNTLSVVESQHNSGKILYNYDFHNDSRDEREICIAGFCTSTDIISSCLAIVNKHFNVCIYPEGISDPSEEINRKGIEYLTWIGIPSYGISINNIKKEI